MDLHTGRLEIFDGISIRIGNLECERHRRATGWLRFQ
jgi:hypothetical protein